MAGASTGSFPIYHRLFNLSFTTHSSISHITLNFPHRTTTTTTISSKPFNLISQLFNPLHPPPSFSFYEEEQQFFESESESESETETETLLNSDLNQEAESTQSRRLFVGNLPFSLSSSQLAQLFGEAGNVVSVEILYDDITNRSRGFAFVTMGNVEDAEEAIRMFDGTTVGGRAIKVNFPEVPIVGKRVQMGSTYRGYVDSPHKIYAGNLGWDMTSQYLRKAFAKQPGLLSAKVVYERNNGKSRGYGFVSFETAEDVEVALSAMNGVEVQGRPLRLKLAVDNRKPSSLDQNKGNNVDSLEMLFGISK